MTEFRDPYDQLDKSELLNTTIEVSQRDHAFLKGLFPHRSVLQITINTLFSRFIAECKKHGLREYDPIRFQQYLISTAITFNARGSAVDPANGTNTNQPVQANSGDDGPGTGSVGVVDKGLSVAARDANEPSKDRQGGKKGKKTKGTGAGV